jgi:GNAT superfamily N-acetyltransferase
VGGEVAQRAGGADVKEFDPTTAPVLAAAMGAEGDLVAARMARGCRCFGAWLGDELVGYAWLSTKPEWIGELEMEIAPARGEGYIWNCVTLDPHRRKGVFGAMVASLVARARREGLSRMWIATLAGLVDNAVVRAGFVQVIRFDTASVLGLRWITIVPADGVDSVLVAAALDVMAIKRDSSVRRSRRRRH